MASVRDVAAFILSELGEMTAWKLQKLVYYSQAWHLVWKERPLFPEEIRAWADGPVAPALYDLHRGVFRLSSLPVETQPLDEEEARVVRKVLAFYGQFSAVQLSELTHRERPWKDTRRGLPAGAPGNGVITHNAMAEFYSALVAG